MKLIIAILNSINGARFNVEVEGDKQMHIISERALHWHLKHKWGLSDQERTSLLDEVWVQGRVELTVKLAA